MGQDTSEIYLNNNNNALQLQLTNYNYLQKSSVIILNFVFTKILSDKFGSGKFIPG